MKPQLNEIIDLKIDRLTYNGGRGIGRHFNFAVFVGGATAPGDVVQAKITRVKKNYAEGTLVQIIKPSSMRELPPCPFYQECGGCQWQHINYSEQLRQKKAFIEFSLKKLKLEIPVHFIASDNQLAYRNRIQLNFVNDKLGYFKEKTNTVTGIDQCLIADDKINALIKNFKKINNNTRYEFSVQQDASASYYPVKEKHPDNLFSQVNSQINLKLIELVLKYTSDETFSAIYDAYCGTGNFTFPLHAKNKQTLIRGIDFSSQNIKTASSKSSDIIFLKDKVERYFANQPAKKNSLVVLDPPRSGCLPSLWPSIAAARKIIYISCNLSTFERDCCEIIKSGFSLKHIYGLDMFPQTYHLETFAVFDKNY